MSLPDDAQGRKGIPLATGFVDYFPSAIVAVAALIEMHDEDAPTANLTANTGRNPVSQTTGD